MADNAIASMIENRMCYFIIVDGIQNFGHQAIAIQEKRMLNQTLFSCVCKDYKPWMARKSDTYIIHGIQNDRRDDLKRKQANYSGPPQVEFELIEPVGIVETVEPINQSGSVSSFLLLSSFI